MKRIERSTRSMLASSSSQLLLHDSCIESQVQNITFMSVFFLYVFFFCCQEIVFKSVRKKQTSCDLISYMTIRIFNLTSERQWSKIGIVEYFKTHTPLSIKSRLNNDPYFMIKHHFIQRRNRVSHCTTVCACDWRSNIRSPVNFNCLTMFDPARSRTFSSNLHCEKRTTIYCRVILILKNNLIAINI